MPKEMTPPNWVHRHEFKYCKSLVLKNTQMGVCAFEGTFPYLSGCGCIHMKASPALKQTLLVMALQIVACALVLYISLVMMSSSFTSVASDICQQHSTWRWDQHGNKLSSGRKKKKKQELEPKSWKHLQIEHRPYQARLRRFLDHSGLYLLAVGSERSRVQRGVDVSPQK